MKNSFVEKYLKDNNLTIIQCDEEKPWGAYYVTNETSDFDEKILWLKPGELLSLQYHGSPTHPGHHERGLALTDMALVFGKTDVSKYTLDEIYEKYVQELEVIFIPAGGTFETQPGFLHAYINPFDHDVHMTEVRTSQIPEQAADREKNIVRIYDTSLRGGTPDWPQWLRDKIAELR
jgi:hypothetical protein